MASRVRFLIVDDHATVREGLVHLLSREFPASQVNTATSPEEALASLVRETFDIAILDLNLAGKDGISLIRNLKEQNPWLRVLVHTMYHEDQFGIRALRAGAAGDLTKDRPVEELFHAIRRLLEGKRFISDSLADRMADSLTRPSEDADPAETLSDREHQVLRMISSGKTMRAIADDLNLSIKTVSTYRSRILEKLGLETTADLIRYGISRQLA